MTFLLPHSWGPNRRAPGHWRACCSKQFASATEEIASCCVALLTIWTAKDKCIPLALCICLKKRSVFSDPFGEVLHPEYKLSESIPDLSCLHLAVHLKRHFEVPSECNATREVGNCRRANHIWRHTVCIYTQIHILFMLYDLWHMRYDMMDKFVNCKLGPFETPEAGTCQAFCLVCQAAFVLPAVVLGLFKSLEKPHKQHLPAQPSTSCPKRQDPLSGTS